MNNLTTPVACLALLFCSVTLSTALAEEALKYKFETLKEQPAMTIRFKVSHEPKEISAKYGEAFTAIYAHVIGSGAQPSAAPFGHYLSVKENELEIEAGLPVAKHLAEKGNIEATTLPGGAVATTIHIGPYEKLGNAHTALQKWVNDSGYKATGGVWGSYLTDPGEEKDKSKWQTKLFLPVVKGEKDN